MNMRIPALIITLFLITGAMAQPKKSPTKSTTPQAVAPKDDNKPVRYIPLPSRIPFYQPQNFFIAGVIDATATNDTIGTAVKSKKFTQKLVLQGGTISFFNSLLDSMVKKDTSLYPVVLKIKRLSIKEVRERYYDRSEAEYEYEFLSVYKNDTIKLAVYSGGGQFSTYMHLRKVYDTAFTSISQGWTRIESNLLELAENHRTFVKGVKVNVHLRTQPASGDTLFYTGEKLNFADFTGTPQLQNGAFAYMHFDYEPVVTYRNGLIMIDVNLATAFVKTRSWLSGEGRSPEVLQHLSYRFKLVHLYTMLLKDRLEAAVLTQDNYKSMTESIYDEVKGEALRKIEQYDDETQYGRKIKEQVKWEQKINKGFPLD